jgi:hypothetical protein
MHQLILIIVVEMIAIISISITPVFSTAISYTVLAQGSTAGSVTTGNAGGSSSPNNDQPLTMSEMSNATSMATGNAGGSSSPNNDQPLTMSEMSNATSTGAND